MDWLFIVRAELVDWRCLGKLKSMSELIMWNVAPAMDPSSLSPGLLKRRCGLNALAWMAYSAVEDLGSVTLMRLPCQFVYLVVKVRVDEGV